MPTCIADFAWLTRPTRRVFHCFNAPVILPPFRRTFLSLEIIIASAVHLRFFIELFFFFLSSVPFQFRGEFMIFINLRISQYTACILSLNCVIPMLFPWDVCDLNNCFVTENVPIKYIYNYLFPHIFQFQDEPNHCISKHVKILQLSTIQNFFNKFNYVQTYA